MNMKLKRKFRSHQEKLLMDLRDPEFADAYLNEALLGEDPRLFLVAFKNVTQAQGLEMTELARLTNLSRVNLYRMLSKKGNPKFVNMISLLNAAGYSISVNANKK